MGRVFAHLTYQGHGMDSSTRTTLNSIRSTDKQEQNDAYYAVMALTDQQVDWAYEVWDDMVVDLTHADNHRRAIAAQVLCGLAKSDPEGRMLRDFDKLLNVTKDERFVTARHCLQALWKVGTAGMPQREMYLKGLTHRFEECAAEKNCTLIRSDIVQSLKNVYEATHDEAVKTTALALIEIEDDLKYRKKYTTVWKSKAAS
jgi:hypothetical protein